MTQKTHTTDNIHPEDRRPKDADRSLLEYLKPKAAERFSKLEAYCDLLSRASSEAYVTPGAEGALTLLPGQFIATISGLARKWQWQRATVRQFLSGLVRLGRIAMEQYSKSYIISLSQEQRLTLPVETPEDILHFNALLFARLIGGRGNARDLAESYNRYFNRAVKTAAGEGDGAMPARHVPDLQYETFHSLAKAIPQALRPEKGMPEELADSVGLLFGKSHVWDWHKVMDALGILTVAIRDNIKPSHMADLAPRHTKGEAVLLDRIFAHYVSEAAAPHHDGPPRTPAGPQEGASHGKPTSASML